MSKAAQAIQKAFAVRFAEIAKRWCSIRLSVCFVPYGVPMCFTPTLAPLAADELGR